ncbi:acylneuraminate cytidylyltransferase family protein [Arthrobacter cupressi]|uniref:N-acylneuraminate cytidylyltransferase n=1 Tax=Arthrobacter cupressi TaxID=1045773 RepID=A0A1G8NZJ4_9MICC|nr:acylneuraminate cytidylyltransferase family protein [Arthrobacter cupressi]NYD76679.1 N-acylneuraminate cytidylyltransferase [Arthrobacter cupressi]SDI85663.1 N-acylneuraminate cytidylyltransferase [Arthrobacter cupressi]
MNENPAGPKVLAVIPARGGSKGLPGKNIRPLLGKPLLAHSVALAGLLGGNVRCIVSTDDPEIAAVATAAGADVPFLRPAELASDTAPMSVVLRHALAAMEDLDGTRYDMVLLLDPTSPTRTPESVRAAIDSLAASPELDGVIAVSEPFFNPTWVGVKPAQDGASHLERYFSEGAGVVRRQDVARFMRINGSFYVWRSEFVRRLENSWFDEGRHGYAEIPETHAFSIDDEREFRLVEAVVSAGLAPLPGVEIPAAGAAAVPAVGGNA